MKKRINFYQFLFFIGISQKNEYGLDKAWKCRVRICRWRLMVRVIMNEVSYSSKDVIE